MTDARAFLRAALDPVRLAVLGRAAAGPVDVDELAAALDVPRRDVLAAVARWRELGVLTPEHALDRSALQAIATSLPHGESADEAIVAGWSPDEARILERFFVGGRLESIPSQHAKRVVVLERIAQEFEPGIRYPERQVNFVLQLYHADYAAVRRYLVDEGFLTRADGVYWRTGGRVDLQRAR